MKLKITDNNNQFVKFSITLSSIISKLCKTKLGRELMNSFFRMVVNDLKSLNVYLSFTSLGEEDLEWKSPSWKRAGPVRWHLVLVTCEIRFVCSAIQSAQDTLSKQCHMPASLLGPCLWDKMTRNIQLLWGKWTWFLHILLHQIFMKDNNCVQYWVLRGLVVRIENST